MMRLCASLCKDHSTRFVNCQTFTTCNKSQQESHGPSLVPTPPTPLILKNPMIAHPTSDAPNTMNRTVSLVRHAVWSRDELLWVKRVIDVIVFVASKIFKVQFKPVFID